MSIATETKVGALVIAAVVGFGWIVTSSGSYGVSTVSQELRPLETEFESADGLTIGSSVKMAGVTVGEISDIYLNGGGYATIIMAIRQGTPLPANVRAQIASSGLIGEKFITLTTDFKPEGTLNEEVIKIPSIGSSSVDDIASNFAQISEDLKQVSATLRNALGGQENADKVARIVNNLDNIGVRLDHFLSAEIKDGQIEQIIDGLAAFSGKLENESGTMIADLRDSAASLKKILGDNENQAGDMIANLNTTAANLSVITDKLAKGEGFLGKLIHEENSALDDFALAMQDIRSAANKINAGEGTIGRLINDPTTADKIEEALDSFTEISGRLNAFTTEIDFNGRQLIGEGIAKGGLNIRLQPRPTRYYVVGVTSDGFATESDDTRSDASFRGEEFGNDMKITAQFGHVFQKVPYLKQDIGLRIGLKDSTFGLGTDMMFDDGKWELSTDLYDFAGQNSGDSNQQPHLDITGRYNIIDRMFYAQGGYDNLLNDKYGSPFIGVGFRFIDDDFKYLASQAL